jgi:hypothetical protein
MSKECWKVSITYDTHDVSVIEAIQVFSRFFSLHNAISLGNIQHSIRKTAEGVLNPTLTL